MSRARSCSSQSSSGRHGLSQASASPRTTLAVRSLVFVKGKLGVDVSVTSGDATKDLADDERIARAILPKLPG